MKSISIGEKIAFEEDLNTGSRYVNAYISDIKKEVARIADIQSNSLKKLNNIEDKIQLLTEADQADMKA